ncbi:hypothetical protein SUGI_0308870 [Cryptomeria japonica]|uniref:mitochondrial outer membrane protein porin of 36 kDa n=1 Tax=Cryptomeria japonica TaxID=3369 RepID=UPI0024089A3A|nr:mitochondrial outer membrane protein porin of 36 kDa [Cryptomeria japonica]XP_057861096.2 mitochondrial outer membrane protein porin of 36 kDa [Cryptomeria japonica]XP_057861097.2 mitochondrial outer membrane protein porin of 36 kDa [Cryptomeria japonica]XP_057861098.2 mitochondrial outer membrane protein porin of 36 kDa [Cryptomeria japonica]GLJ17699.1 hypothetical protein SUGI_0308870 [Cryptomeria japonica]
MVKGPGLFSDIGKKTRDLLYKDFLFDQKFTLTTYTSTGLAFTSTGTKKGELFLGDLTTQLKNKNITTDIKVDTSSNLIATVTIDEPTPGLKTSFSFTIPDQRSGKAEIQYLHDYAGITASIGLTATPVVEASVVVGNEAIAVGGELAFDTTSGNLRKYNAGISYTMPDFISSVHVTDKGDTMKGSYYHIVSPLTKTAVGAEVAHSFSKNENVFTIGTQYALDPLTTVKGRLDNRGKVAGLVQHEWRPKSLITFSGEVDTKALDNSAKLGLSVLLKP